MMSRMIKGAMVCAGLLAGCGVENDYFRTMRGERVYALEGGVFEVALMDQGYLPGYWCNAGDYARRALGAGWTDRVYVHRGLGPGVAANRINTVLFTLSPPASQPPQTAIVRVNAFKAGQSLTVRSAESQCRNDPFRFGG